MRKLNLFWGICLMFFALSVAVVPAAQAQSKSVIKAAKKTAKKVAKDLEKEGWELVGIGTIEDAVYEALLKTKTGYHDYSVTVSDYGNLLLAQKAARLNAMAQYAAETNNEFDNLFDTQVTGIPQATTDQVKDGFTAHMGATINSQLREAYTLSRKVGNTYEVQAHYLLNLEDAFEYKLRALRQAITVAKLSKEHEAALEKGLEENHQKEMEEIENGEAEE